MTYNPNQHYMAEFWQARQQECQKGLEIAVARLALLQNPQQLRFELQETETLVAPSVPQDLHEGIRQSEGRQ